MTETLIPLKYWENWKSMNVRALFAYKSLGKLIYKYIYIYIYFFLFFFNIFFDPWCLNKTPWKNAVFNSVPRERVPPGPVPNPSQSAGAVCTSRGWNVFGSKRFHAGQPNNHVQVVDHRSIFWIRALPTILHLGEGRGDIIFQGPWPTWTKTSRRPVRPPQSFVRTSPRSYFTQTPRCSHPTSS